MFILRDYQEKIINNTKSKLLQGHRRIICQAPTGAGKTVIFSYIVANAIRKGGRVLILTNRMELLTETGGTLEGFNIPFEQVKAGTIYPPSAKCIVAMAQTLRNRIEAKRYPKAWANFFKSFTLVIIDECHIQDYNIFLDNMDIFQKNITVLGFSATPDATHLANYYTALVHGPTTQELIDKGYLVKDRYIYAKSINTKGLRKNSRGDDYAESDQYMRFNKRELYGDAIKAWKQYAQGKMTLVFCVNIQHAVNTCRQYNDAGIKAKFLTSEISKPQYPKKPTEANLSRYNKKLEEYNNWLDGYRKYSGERDEILTQWKNREFDVLINAAILTTGFNCPAIEVIQVLRATFSLPLWLQMIGRGSRTYEGKEYFTIIDHGNNGERLCMYRTPIKYNLVKSAEKGKGVAPVKECGAKPRKGVKPDPNTGYYPDKDGRPGCGAYINASADICPYCGYRYETKKEIIEAEFEEYKYEIERADNMPLKKVDEINEIIKTQEARGYKEGWAIRRIWYKFGEEGLKKYAKKTKKAHGWLFIAKKIYKFA